MAQALRPSAILDCATYPSTGTAHAIQRLPIANLARFASLRLRISEQPFDGLTCDQEPAAVARGSLCQAPLFNLSANPSVGST